MDASQFLFPHDKPRKVQLELLSLVNGVVRKGKNLVVHAPTGIGKTAAVLAPVLRHALDNGKTVFFLTSRHTEHLIAIETLKAVKERHGSLFKAVDIVGKKWLCLQGRVERLGSGEFAEYCRKLREDGLCSYYSNLRNGEKLSVNAQRALKALKGLNPALSSEVKRVAASENVCPYETAMLLSKNADVVVTDYFYIFNPSIRESFFKRLGKELGDCIIVVDEGHNLPERVKDLASSQTSNLALRRAAAEADEWGDSELGNALNGLAGALEKSASRFEEEALFSREELVRLVERFHPYEGLALRAEELGGEVREERKRSYLGGVADFLKAWMGGDEGFLRVMSKKQGKRLVVTLRYKCLDPSIVTAEVLNNAYCSIVMSGTLTPTRMYKELLGLKDCLEASYPNPFPKKNRLSLILPLATTQYSKRGVEEYERIATVVERFFKAVPGNCIAFFPSYQLKEEVERRLVDAGKEVLSEQPGMGKAEKHELLERFKKSSLKGAALLAVISGSFGEGVDLPGNYLRGVLVVGLPLQKPDLESKALIKYYDEKFGKGWDYGYVYPAFNKALQSAGRCIRSATDRGVVAFLDKRYSWPRYRECFPPDWELRVSADFEREVTEFFKEG